MSREISLLMPDAKEKLLAAIEKMKKANIGFFVDSTLRTVDEQKALYAQGRQPLAVVNQLRKTCGMYQLSESENGYTVTNCDGVANKSRHQSGKAVDVVPVDARGRPYWPATTSKDWLPIAGAMKEAGFKWGGDWKEFPDFPHYEI